MNVNPAFNFRALACEISEIEAMRQFAENLYAAGLDLGRELPVMDGEMHYVPLLGQAEGKSGGYKGYFDAWPAGGIWNFKTGDFTPWRADGQRVPMSPAQYSEMIEQAAQAAIVRAAQRLEREKEAQQRAIHVWNHARAADETNPYLIQKAIPAGPAREDRDGNLLIPMRDLENRLWSLQSIRSDGQKRFLSGGRKHGLSCSFGHANETIWLAEGFATASTVHAATRMAVKAAFDAANLVSLAHAVRQKYPDLRLMIAGDDDAHLRDRELPLPNVAQEKAEAAARQVNGVAVLPVGAKDFNDLANARGLAAVTEQLLTAWWLDHPAHRPEIAP